MPDIFDRIANGTATDIEKLAGEAFDRFWQLVSDGMDPGQAIAQAQASFSAEVKAQVAAAFSELLAASVGSTAIPLAMPDTPLVLSRLLYRQTAAVASQVRAMVRQHAAGVHQARDLAMSIYDGYVKIDPGVRPLEGRAKGQLPKDLQALLQSDPRSARSLSALIERARAQIARVRTAPLRAAYSEALDKWEKGARNGLRRELKVAIAEKNRYFANRIAQTELARAYQRQRAAEYMADPEVKVLEVRITPGHPKTDICDLHARADLFGLGPGCYPKKLAPLPPFHPFCRCRLRDRPDLDASKAKPGSVAKYLEKLDPRQAAEIMGSRAKLQQVLAGQSYEDVINTSKDPNYWLARAGSVVPVTISPMPHPDAIPGHDKAQLPDAKLTEYALNYDNDVGRNKARVFESVLGFTRENASELKQQVLGGLGLYPAVPKLLDDHGQRYEVDIEVTGPKGRAIVTTGWIVRPDVDFPSLTSIYVNSRRRV